RRFVLRLRAEFWLRLGLRFWIGFANRHFYYCGLSGRGLRRHLYNRGNEHNLVRHVSRRYGLDKRLGSRLSRAGLFGLRIFLGLLAQPAKQAFLFTGLDRRLLVVVGTKHGNEYLKGAPRHCTAPASNTLDTGFFGSGADRRGRCEFG